MQVGGGITVIDLGRKKGGLFPIFPRTNMPMATHTVNELQSFFDTGCLHHRFPKNNVSQPFLQYSGSLSDALICDSANTTNNQNTARRMFVLVYGGLTHDDCLVQAADCSLFL